MTRSFTYTTSRPSGVLSPRTTTKHSANTLTTGRISGASRIFLSTQRIFARTGDRAHLLVSTTRVVLTKKIACFLTGGRSVTTTRSTTKPRLARTRRTVSALSNAPSFTQSWTDVSSKSTPSSAQRTCTFLQLFFFA